MKKQTTILFAHLGSVQVKTLTTIVDETLALDYNQPASKTFSAAELWNIQRQKKALVQRRYSL